MIDLNPLNVLDIRKLDRIPVHFSKIKLGTVSFDIREIDEWINDRCSGRYSVQSIPTLDNGKMKNIIFAGFEEEKEITYFMLACPFFRR
jgi:hypothetical protein